MAIKGISSDSIFEKIAELRKAATLVHHYFARIPDRGMKADRCLEWLRQAISSDSKFEKIAEILEAAIPGPHHSARILDGGMKADRGPE